MLRKTVERLARTIVDSPAFRRLVEVGDARSDNRMTELGMIAQAFEFRKINAVPGDYFEFGLWQGKTFLHAHRMKRRYNAHDLTLLGFDSFQGLPAIDDSKDNIWQKGQFAFGEADLRRRLARHGVRSDEFDLFPGFYSESLNPALRERLRPRKAAIIYVDCDLYESTKPVLSFMKDFMVDGTIICFDDYYNYKGAPDQGEQKAIQEFLASNPDVVFIPYYNYSPLGRSFIVRLDGSR